MTRPFRLAIHCAGLGAFSLVVLFPIYWTIVTSLKAPKDTISSIPIFWPESLAWENWRTVWENQIFPALPNSILVSFTSSIIAVVLGSAAGYALSRFRFRNNLFLEFWILSTRMMPPIASAIPLFVLLSSVKLLDNRFGLILVYVMFNLPFVIWITKSFFDEVPPSVEEAAMIDGCSQIRVFWNIAVPTALPGIVSAAIFSMIFSWNEFLFALVLTRREAVTLPIAISSLESVGGIFWGELAALSAISIIPVLFVAIVIQGYVVRGVSMGAVKG
jgi:multiple sugar transport system permease protein